MPKIPDINVKHFDDRGFDGRDQFFAWFNERWPEPKGSRQQKANHTFKRKTAYDAWAACEDYGIESFKRHMAAAVKLGEIHEGTARYVCEVLKTAFETPLAKENQRTKPCFICNGRGEYRSDLETGLVRCGCVPAEPVCPHKELDLDGCCKACGRGL